MKYERRTYHRLVPETMLMCSGKCVALEIYNRLAEIEDKIEIGEIDDVADRDKEISRLTAENAELRATLSKMETVEKELEARLEKAVELPYEVGSTVYIS